MTKNNTVKSLLAFGILALGSAAPSWAVSIPVTNFSFESPAAPLGNDCGTGCSFNFGPVTGWTITVNGGVFHPDSSRFNFPLPDGDQTAYNNGGSLSQTLAATLQNSTTYTLNVAVGNRLDPQGFPGYSVALLAGSTVLGTESSQTPALGDFALSTVTFTSAAVDPLAGQALSIVLTSTGGGQTNFDNVRLDAVSSVPEPSSLLLLSGGLVGVLAIARRKRRV